AGGKAHPIRHAVRILLHVDAINDPVLRDRASNAWSTVVQRGTVGTQSIRILFYALDRLRAFADIVRGPAVFSCEIAARNSVEGRALVDRLASLFGVFCRLDD